MPTNELIVEKNGDVLEVKCYDSDGQVHDITDKFRGISGKTTAAGVVQNIFEGQADGTAVKIDFHAQRKELKFGLDEITSKQICALAD